MQDRFTSARARSSGWLMASVFLLLASSLVSAAPGYRPPNRDGKKLRRTPLVELVERCKHVAVDIGAEHATDDKQSLRELVSLAPAKGKNGKENPRQFNRGSGFIIHHSGYVITNAHVVKGTIAQEVRLANGKVYPARIIALNEDKDLGLLKVEVDKAWPTATLAISDDIIIGEDAFTIGNPDGLNHSVATGIVAGINRASLVNGKRRLTGLVQLSLPSNPGNSGGPIFNRLGEVIAVAQSTKMGWQSMAFAVAIKDVRTWVPMVLQSERRAGIETGWTLKGNGGRVIAAVSPDSAAAAAGLRVGDVLEKVGDRVIDSAIDVELALLDQVPGNTLPIEIDRVGKPVRTKISLRPRKRKTGSSLLKTFLGVETKPVDRAFAKKVGLRNRRGLILTSVRSDLYSGSSRPVKGDVLVKIGNELVTDVNHAAFLLDSYKSNDKFPIVFLRFKDGRVTRLDINITLK